MTKINIGEMFNRGLAILLALLMVISFVPIYVYVSAEYENTYQNTGDQISDIIGVALTQVGYTEGANNDTKYGDWYTLPNNPWCAMFVSWCANEAGISTSIIPKHASCDVGMSWFKSANQWKYSQYHGGTYIPQKGDIIYFGSLNDSTHVGIVYYISGNYVYTIEGNASNKVKINSYLLSNETIVGYGIPAYVVSSSAYPSRTYTLSQLREKFPHGKYWNHAGNPGASNSANNQDGYTATPCSIHGVVGTDKQTCNGFQPGDTQLSWQCMGYAEKLGYDATGFNPRNNSNGWYTYTSSASLDNLKPGDIVRYKNDRHSIYVIGVNGDTVTYTDCNNDGHCIIRWDATISKSTLKASFTHLRSAPYSVVDNPTVCNCSTSYAGTYTCTTSSKNLTIRSGHGSTYGVVGSIPSGATVTVTKASGTSSSDWAHVTYNGVSGYASMQYLSKQQTINPGNSPVGVIDSYSGGTHSFSVRGWVYDADDTSSQLELYMYISGNYCGKLKADQLREDVNSVYGCGAYHGYEGTIFLDPSITGQQSVDVWAQNVGGGEYTLLGTISVNIEADTFGPEIHDVQVWYVGPTGYTVTVYASDPSGISNVKFPTWTGDDQDDLVPDWTSNPTVDGTKSGDSYIYRVKVSDHNNEYGIYHTDVYAYDKYGNPTCYAIEVNLLKPDYTVVSKINGDDFYAYIENVGSGTVLTHDTKGNGYGDYDSVFSACTKEDTQIWHFIKNEDNSYRISPKSDESLALHVTAGDGSSGNSVILHTAMEHDAQRWFITEVDGNYWLRPACSDDCYLDLREGSTANGVSAQIYSYNNTLAQQFNLSHVHNYGVWNVVSAPTCTGKGTEQRECKNCDHFETRETDATGHRYTSNVTAPTCTAQGYTTYTCSCGHSYKDNYTNATEHSYSNGSCTKCGAVDPDYSADAPTISLTNITSTAGSTVRVPLMISNNPGIVSASITITYDETVMTLVEIEDAGLLSGAVHSPQLNSPYQLTWMNPTLSDNITGNGTLAILVFEISEEAQAGEYALDISYDFENYDIVNVDMEPVRFAAIGATVTVIDWLYGDVNNDGRVNMLDGTILARHVAKWPDYTSDKLNMLAADVNNDGKVNMLDSTILARHIAKWPDYSEFPYGAR